MNVIQKTVNCLRWLRMPVYKKTVLFSSFYGQYNDNPKYVSKLMHEQHPEWEQIWVRSSKSNECFPDYAKTVEAYSPEYYEYACRAQVVVDNHSGIRASFFPKGDPIKKFRGFLFGKKRNDQFCISTWHGTPLKRIALDEPKNAGKDFITNSDYIVSGCKLTSDALHSSLRNKLPVKPYGTPRNDILIKNDFDRNVLKDKLGLPRDKRVILFAPTFRDNVEDSGVNQIKSLDFEALLQALHEAFGGDWVFVFRLHNLVLKEITIEEIIPQEMEGLIINGNKGDDMAEYLACTDALITDYSGSMFDFILTRKPTLLFVPDIDHYRNVERGLYLELDEIPFPFAKTSEDLVVKIRAYDPAEYDSQISRFMKDQEYTEQGTASKQILEDIERFIQTGEKP